MSTPRSFSNLLNTEIEMFAAWLPVTNTFRLGDYGLMSDGVFHQIGHISAFLGTDAVGLHNMRKNDTVTPIDLKSEGTDVVRMAGGTKVAAYPDVGDIEAKMEIGFNSEDSFLVKAKLTLEELDNKDALANQLNEQDRWKAKYRVISSIYKTENCTIISAKSAGAKITLGGTASALKALDAGSVSGDVAYTSSEKIGLEVIGESGVMGLRLFKLHWWNGGIQILSNDVSARSDAELEVVPLDGPGDSDNDV